MKSLTNMQQDRIAELELVLINISNMATHYKDIDSKVDLKYGYSRILEEIADLSQGHTVTID